ncbi:MAG: DNA mismatch repair protein MutS [Bdellovibrionales bacterium]|nr:DNA mismatch repair protein MutS [Bdellovibrionales bacterium]
MTASSVPSSTQASPAQASGAVTKRKLPPMLEEYLSYKRRYPDHVLFFQVGDFYELFFEDAVVVAKTLNLTLTSRDKKDPNPIPMCGVPISVIDGYLERLIDTGVSAAVVSQVAGDRPAKGMVERKLERVITPGVRIMSAVESANSQRECIAALGAGTGTDLSLAWGTATQPNIRVRERIQISEVVETVLRLEVAEIILPTELHGKRLDRRTTWVRELERFLPPQAIRFRSVSDQQLATETERLGQASQFSLLSLSAKRAVRNFVRYIDEATVSANTPFLAVELEDTSSLMTLDTMTRKNLELTETAREKTYQGSLLHYLDHTQTFGGKRLLRNWVNYPLIDRTDIEARHAAVHLLLSHFDLRSEIRDLMKFIPDLERICARVNLCICSPRELAALRDGIEAIGSIRSSLRRFEDIKAVPLLYRCVEKLDIDESLLHRLSQTLTDNPPPQVSDGGVIREGLSEEIDQLRRISLETEDWLRAFEQEEREKTGIGSLKVRSNNAVGLFIEVTKANKDKVPNFYIPRQTLTNGVRFTTEQLREWEKRLSSAEIELKRLEALHFQELILTVKEYCPPLRDVHEATSLLDVLCGFAKLAEEDELVAPEFCFESSELDAHESWHPVLKKNLEEKCIHNNIVFNDERRCLVLTGPNMGGKSTYLRQVGLLVLLAQIGSFVPARSMKTGVFDRVFARLGASDDIHEGDSTFMVEMKEAAVIARNASPNSLILIDELGRGTATADGLSIAKSLLEHLVTSLNCCCLFATHFHELVALESEFPTIRNIAVNVVEQGGEVLFTHEVVDGAANRSYGIEVARLAGIPEHVIRRAAEYLAMERIAEATGGKNSQLSLSLQPYSDTLSEDRKRLSDVTSLITEHHPDDMSPRSALELLYAVYALLSPESK